MKHRKLPDAIQTFRIGDTEGQYPVFSGEGAAANRGRWHDIGDEVIYTASVLSLAMLEKLVWLNGIMPPDQHMCTVSIPAGVTYEQVNVESIVDWVDSGSDRTRELGHTWYEERRSLILVVPSSIVRTESNIIINVNHPEFDRIKHSLEKPLLWDKRLFN